MAKPLRFNLINWTMTSILLAVTASISGCGESTSSTQGSQFANDPTTPPVNNEDFNQTLLLQNLTDNVILPTYSKFAELAAEQENAIALYCDALSTQADDTEDKQTLAKQSWREAMAVWQMAEVMQIGPLIENNSALRNKIYSWPNTSSCAIDQDVVLAEQDSYDINTRTASRKGLDAIEYLLFNPVLSHSCTVFGTEPEGWNNRPDSEKTEARCQFAKLVATDLVSNSQTLLTAWNGTASAEGYADILKNAGQNTTFNNVHDAVNDVSDGLFYIDTFTKDAKLATPLGVFANDCGLAPCVQNVESPFAFNSLQNIINNIQGLNLIFLGGETEASVGFDDYLIDAGATETAQQMRTDLNEVSEFALGIQKSLTELLEQDPEQVQQVHDQLKKVTDNLKNDFIQSLALELPATSAGDND
ncbi:imelysin family protein [Paraglaciecola sp.]|uniref:imelysin family protein n=1 Tax=Paraglaciecola sp. TaxID=1920173 RepID=UPI003EF8BC8C